MRAPRKLWQASNLAEELGIPPHEVYRLDKDDELLCYSFDHAVLTFANALKERIRVVTKDAKNEKAAERKMHSEMMKWLSSDDPAAVKGRFRDPFASGAPIVTRTA